jgi:transposase
MTSTLDLSQEERQALMSLMRARTAPASAVKRARLILMLDEGLSWSVIGERLPCTADYIGRWKRRFAQERLAGLYARHRGRPPARDAAKVAARVLAWTQKTPPDGSTHWSTRKLGEALGVSHMMVAHIWAKHAIKPHRLERYMASDDPDF